MRNLITVFAILAPLSSIASTSFPCSEKVTRVHIHGNGNIYFNTDTVCKGTWCKIDWPDQQQVNRAYSAMLTSITADRNMTFQWNRNDHSSCSETASTPHISPVWIDFH